MAGFTGTLENLLEHRTKIPQTRARNVSVETCFDVVFSRDDGFALCCQHMTFLVIMQMHWTSWGIVFLWLIVEYVLF